MDFDRFFRTATGSAQGSPYAYQRHLATGPAVDPAASRACESGLIDIPTGYGKTAAVTLAWLWNRVQCQHADWPRRLVYCLPMRVLVEQTRETIRASLANLGLSDRVGLHVLMGGVEAGDWHLAPERDSILLGTQDMLLSRALNRGYGAFRARWPVDFGLLHHDCLWVFDEVQLFDVGLATSVQLHAFRQHDAARTLRPCHGWWMSATLQPAWFHTVDFAPHLGALESGTVRLSEADRSGALWSANKHCRLESLAEADDKDCKKWAQLVFDQHRDSQETPWGRITLVIANTVKRAMLLYDALAKILKNKSAVDLRLVHSRFRGAERQQWRNDFLNREACRPGVDRIIISTQIVEAGVDLTASTLLTELAPWPSLVQRFGRAARYGGTAQVVVVDRALTGKASLPYDETQLAAAREAFAHLENASLAGLAALDEGLRANGPDLYRRLYPYDPAHLLTRRELDELFDTTPDLTGADLDISRFIRAGDERDLSVFWRAIPDEPTLDADLQPARDELCPVPIADARKWLCQDNNERLHEGCRAWVWDYTEDEWRPCRRADLFPGRTVLVDEKWGGYDAARGFTAQKPGRDARSFALAPTLKIAEEEKSDAAQERDDLSHLDFYKTILTHSKEVAAETRTLTAEAGLPEGLRDLFDLAARLHDWGKAHPVFQAAIKDKGSHADRTDFAKAPAKVWKRGYERRGFRHELASTLAVLELLRRADQWHEGLLGPHRDVLAALGETIPPADADPVADELSGRLQSLDADSLNLLLYLICTHHGKVRGAWHAAPLDQEQAAHSDDGRMPLRGVCEGDETLAVRLPLADDDAAPDLPPLTLHLDAAALGLSARYGASWSERVLGLLEKHGPFTLAYFEALFRCADVRASKLTTPDPLLSNPTA